MKIPAMLLVVPGILLIAAGFASADHGSGGSLAVAGAILIMTARIGPSLDALSGKESDG